MGSPSPILPLRLLHKPTETTRPTAEPGCFTTRRRPTGVLTQTNGSSARTGTPNRLWHIRAGQSTSTTSPACGTSLQGRIGLDIAKNVFQVHGVDDNGTVVIRKRLRRPDILGFFASLPPCLIGIEACSASHHWARELIRLGHEVRLMPARYVKPYVQRGKSDALDAEAICEAVSRPTMRFATIKTAE